MKRATKQGSTPQDGVEVKAAGSAPSRYTVQVLAKALEVLDVLALFGPLNLADISQRVDQPKSSTFRYLVTLEEQGYVVRNSETDHYRLGTRLIELGHAVTRQFSVHDEAIGPMRKLVARFQETVNLATLEDGQAVYLEILEGTQSIRMVARPGQRDFVHSTAIGKSILAHLDEAECQSIVRRHGMPALTEVTITSWQDLKAELARVRQQGYAVDNMENGAGVRCIGAPIFNYQGRAVAAISVSGPALRMNPQQVEQIGRELVAATRAISARLGYSSP